MNDSPNEGGRGFAFKSMSGNETGCNAIALEIMKLEGFVMGNRNGNSQTSGDYKSFGGAQTASASTESNTSAIRLWERGPMTTEPMIVSASSSAISLDQNTNANSPSSNAAAALLVGMSMRKERESNNASKPTTASSANQASVSFELETEQSFDVEAKWREIRLEVSQQTETLAPSSKEPNRDQEGLELPKGVTRRPSGSWQAQIYYAGMTRYIGVWERPHQAAIAYNLAKEAVDKLKAQEKSRGTRRKRLRHPRTIDTKMGSSKTARKSQLTTPQRELKVTLPPSITWPSSASSSSTITSTGFRSPYFANGLSFQALNGTDLSPPATCLDGSFDKAQKPQPILHPHVPPPRGPSYSAFSQHIHPQENNVLAFNHKNTNLTNPALQLLSLRPPPQLSQPQPTALWQQPQPSPPSYQQQQQNYHVLHQPLYSQPLLPSKADSFPQTMDYRNKSTNLLGLNQGAPTEEKDGRKTVQKKGSKQSAINHGSNRKKSKPKEASNGKRDAENEKWKSIRTEVLAFLDDSKRGEPDGSDASAQKTFDKDVLRGITVRPSGKFQAQLYFGGRSRYIGVFDSEYEAASAYEMIRSRLKGDPKSKTPPQHSSSSSVVSSVQNPNDNKHAKAKPNASSTTMVRSITPSPTPKGKLHGKKTKTSAQ